MYFILKDFKAYAQRSRRWRPHTGIKADGQRGYFECGLFREVLLRPDYSGVCDDIWHLDKVVLPKRAENPKVMGK